MMRHSSRRPYRGSQAARRAGFTLLEVIIVMSLVTLLAGVILPATGAVLRSKSRAATIEEMGLLSVAVQEYYRDTRQFPSSVLDLMSAATPGWSGPYLPGSVTDPWSGQGGYAVDGFGTAYTLSTAGLELTITSLGADRTSGTADDIPLAVNVTPLLREMTLVELRAINGAIAQYNAAHLATDPLPGNYAVALSTLESAGFLPPGAGYATDEWGDAYTGDPPSVSPMTAVISPNISAGP